MPPTVDDVLFYRTENSSDRISLRDFFAAFAMQGRLAAGFNADADSSGLEAVIAYQIADAMLHARQNGDPPAPVASRELTT